MAFERRLTKEREKDDHLYGDKDTFVTSAYKKKLQETGKWKEEERLRELREQAHEVLRITSLFQWRLGPRCFSQTSDEENDGRELIAQNFLRRFQIMIKEILKHLFTILLIRCELQKKQI